MYPLFETALRAKLDHGIEEHQRYTSELWSRFAAVAAGVDVDVSFGVN